VKLHCIGVNYNVKWDARLNCWSNLKHRAKLADSHFPHHIFNLVSIYIHPLHLRYKLLHGNTLLQNSAKFPLTDVLVFSYYFEIQIEHSDIYAKLSNAHSVLRHHSDVANV
jgi:hypothetical protein